MSVLQDMCGTVFKASHLRRITLMVIAVLVMGVTAAISFQVRELVAALLMFSVVFGAIGAGLLLMMLVEEVALLGVARTATRLAPVKDRLTLFRNTLASARHLKSH